MSFIDKISGYRKEELLDKINSAGERDVVAALSKDRIGTTELLYLLSPAADGFLEEMALKANRLTMSNFGKTIQLYTPLYLSNYCDNRCLYCGFRADSSSKARKLDLDEVRAEGEYIAGTGLRHVLLLTGSSRSKSPVSYIADCVNTLLPYFSSIGIEVYPLSIEEYARLIAAGVDGLTVYQEVYDREVYDELHPVGPKKDYVFRMGAPERAAEAGIRTINVGALLGLADWRTEFFFSAIHARYLQTAFPSAEISISFPRMRPYSGKFVPRNPVSDRDLVRLITAARIFLPRVGITISTRENAVFRENILPLGVTKISAGSTTCVGGHTLGGEKTEQFEISDPRDVGSVKEMLRKNGYQPVMKDWLHI